MQFVTFQSYFIASLHAIAIKEESMKRLSILIFSLLASCSDTNPEFVKWHDYSIPASYILGEIGGSGLYSIGAETRDDVTVELQSDTIVGKYVQYTLTPASNFSNDEAKARALNLATGGGILEQHGSGLYKLSQDKESIHWQLVSPEYNGKTLVDVEPVATCSQLKSSPASCTFGFVDDGVYYTFSLSGSNISNHQDVRYLIRTKLSEWKVH